MRWMETLIVVTKGISHKGNKILQLGDNVYPEHEDSIPIEHKVSNELKNKISFGSGYNFQKERYVIIPRWKSDIKRMIYFFLL